MADRSQNQNNVRTIKWHTPNATNKWTKRQKQFLLNRCEAINFLTNKWRKWGACFGNHVVKNLTPPVPLGNARHVFNLRKSTNSNEPAIRKRTLDYSIITNIKKIAFREKDLLESDILHSWHTSLTAFSARGILLKSELKMRSENENSPHSRHTPLTAFSTRSNSLKIWTQNA